VAPGWDEYLDWSLLLERRSFAYFSLSSAALFFFLLMRMVLGWLADRRLHLPRFRLRANLRRAAAAFFATPEVKIDRVTRVQLVFGNMPRWADENQHA
jgi:hypothetical protein